MFDDDQSWFKELSDKEIDAMLKWGESEEYLVLKRILKVIERHNLAMLVRNPITEAIRYELAEWRGRHLEDKSILEVPDKIRKGIELRNKEKRKKI